MPARIPANAGEPGPAFRSINPLSAVESISAETLNSVSRTPGRSAMIALSPRRAARPWEDRSRIIMVSPEAGTKRVRKQGRGYHYRRQSRGGRESNHGAHDDVGGRYLTR